MLNDADENPPLIVECPHCYTKVIPLANNICPACRRDISDMHDVDPTRASLIIHESEELPSFCYECNRYTERHVRISGDKESGLEKVILFLFTRPSRRTDVDTSNVIIHIPQCEQCGELDDPEPVYVDYEHQTMTFVVHRGFRDRVLQLRGI